MTLCAVVLREVAGCRVCLPTHIAGVQSLTSVPTSMLSLVTRSSEPLPTVLTHERLLASVDTTNVLLQVA